MNKFLGCTGLLRIPRNVITFRSIRKFGNTAATPLPKPHSKGITDKSDLNPNIDSIFNLGCPVFLSKSELRLFEKDGQDASESTGESNEYKLGDEVVGKITFIGKAGASVQTASRAIGMISIEEILRYEARHSDEIKVGDLVAGFVTRVRDDGSINITLRPIMKLRLDETARIVLDAIKNSMTHSLPIGDKSSPENILLHFPGMSKSDFKKAIGILYRKGSVVPGDYEVRLARDDDKLVSSSPEVKYHYLSKNSIFVSNLAESVTQDSLRSLINSVMNGSYVKTIRIPLDPETKKLRSYGFVEFVDESSHEKALNLLKNIVINNIKIRISDASKALLNSDENSSSKENVRIDINTIFVGNIDSSVTEDSLRSFIDSVMNGSYIKSIRLPIKSETKKSGFGFVEFVDKTSHEKALSLLKNAILNNRKLRVQDSYIKRVDTVEDNASNENAKAKDFLSIHTIFVGNMPSVATEDSLRSLINSVMNGSFIKAIRLPLNPETKKLRGYGFVEFVDKSSHEKALILLKKVKMNNRILRINDSSKAQLNSGEVKEASKENVQAKDMENNRTTEPVHLSSQDVKIINGTL